MRRCTKKNGSFAVQKVEKVSFLVGLRDGVSVSAVSSVTREREGEAKVWQNREAICDLFYGTLLQQSRGGRRSGSSSSHGVDRGRRPSAEFEPHEKEKKTGRERERERERGLLWCCFYYS